IAASALDWAGVSPELVPHGQSLKTLIDQPSATRDFAYGEWDLNPQNWGLDLKLRVVRTTRHKMTMEMNSGAGELYDLQEDPFETTNLFDQESKLKKEFEDMIRSRPNDQIREALVPSGLH
ncbi:MAG: sulfatase/phosphatase domain-containing protein, partial [bacterium]